MTRKELAEQVNLAYDDYFNAIQELGTANGIDAAFAAPSAVTTPAHRNAS